MFALAEKLKYPHPRHLLRELNSSDVADWMAYYQARAELAKEEEPDEDRPMDEREISDNLMQWKAVAESKARRGGIQ